MEIDIPSLDDVEFEQTCWNTAETCRWCHGAGTYLTPVGEKLVKFLEARGVDLAPLPKVKE